MPTTYESIELLKLRFLVTEDTDGDVVKKLVVSKLNGQLVPLILSGETLIETGGSSTPPNVFDLNAAPYNMVPNDPSAGAANATALTQAILDAVTYAQAHGSDVILEGDPGNYNIGDTLLQNLGSNGVRYNTLIEFPILAQGSQQCVLTIRPKGGRVPNTHPFYTLPQGDLIFSSTLTSDYDTTYGWPSMFGATAWKSGHADDITKASWLTVCFQSVAFRQPADPSLCDVDATYLDRVVYEDCRWDTTDTLSGGHYLTPPSHPTGVANLPPMNALDGLEYRGFTECQGRYAGPAIGELMANHGTMFIIENYVGLNYQTEFSHPANIGHYIDCRNTYGIARVDPILGVVQPTGSATMHSPITGVLWDIEYEETGHWRDRIADLNDSGDVCHGYINYYRVKAGGAEAGTDIVKNGGANFNGMNLANSSASSGSGDSGWINVTFENSWQNYPSNVPCRYRKINGVVHLKGVAQGGNAGATIFTLPSGFRPNQTNSAGPILNAIGSQGGQRRVHEIDITSDGHFSVADQTINGVHIQSTQDFISLDGISFVADG